MSGAYGKADDQESIRTIRRAIDLGVTMLDTAATYGAGHNETLVGRAVKGLRDRVVIATKFGTVTGPDGRFAGVDARPQAARSACEGSLLRLQIDMIDIYYLHRVDPRVPIEESIGAMARLVEEGKVRAIGICEAAPGTIRRANAVHPLAAVQMEYSLWFREPEEQILPLCLELGVGFVAYSPLGRSLLTGGLRDVATLPEGDERRRHPRFQGADFVRNLDLVRRLEAIASARNVTLAQLALAWLLARGDHIVPIPGTRTRKHLDSNIQAGALVLSAGDLAMIDEAAPPGSGAGARYPDEILSSLNQ
jgi:aryl-alcohol dehydrogenase-like predicted oxidoreductase